MPNATEKRPVSAAQLTLDFAGLNAGLEQDRSSRSRDHDAPASPSARSRAKPLGFTDQLLAFRDFGQPTRCIPVEFQSAPVDMPDTADLPSAGTARTTAYVNEFWTARQRQANSLHEISYRACFKPQLPRFFIERLTQPGDVVYDPFMGRGTTPLEAALLGRIPWGNDANPLSILLTAPRLHPPVLRDVEARLAQIELQRDVPCPEDLLVFYHPRTLRAVCCLREYLLARRKSGQSDHVDNWLALVAMNRLTGHSSGFFSVYTLPPNQAVSVKSQQKINARRNQTPPERDVKKILLKKSRILLQDVASAETRAALANVASHARLLTGPADATSQLPADSVALVVTSPPFLDVVQYAADNWLRCWFMGIDVDSVELTVPRKLKDWRAAMTSVLRELRRLLKPGGHVAFEVGEVHGGATRLEEAVLPCGMAVGLEPLLVLINDQKFTKTANCWGVDNMAKGTNTNRVVLFRKNG